MVGFDVGWIVMCVICEIDVYGEIVWWLIGDKWFCLNVDVDFVMVFVWFDGVLDGIKGFVLFLLLKMLLDGMCNCYWIVWLKDKFGSCLMVSGEIVFEGV